jgi:beta-lactamase regulating signal transducer with metallopeptidase domain
MSDFVIHSSPKLFALLLDSAFRALLLACFLAVVLLAFRVRDVRAKLLVWRVLLFIALVMPVLMLLSPGVPIPVPVPSFSRNSSTTNLYGAERAAQYPAIEMRLPEDAQIARNQSSTAQPQHVARPQSSAAQISSSHVARTISWSLLAMAVYLAFSLLLFARVVIGLNLGKRLTLAAETIEDAEALNLLGSISQASNLRRLPRLAESSLVSVPVTLGVCQTSILLPSTWHQWDGGELAAVLAHEISHVARRDSCVQLLALIHRAIFWFSPLSWWLNRHLAEFAEQASDEAALASGADRTRYAQALVGFLADLEASPARIWWHGVAMAKTGQGEKRVERILAWKSSMSSQLSKSFVVVLIAICAPVVALTVSAHPSAYSPQEIAAPPSPPAPPPPDQFALPPADRPAPIVEQGAPPAPPAVAALMPPEPDSAVGVPAPAPQAPSQSNKRAAPAAPAQPQPTQTPWPSVPPVISILPAPTVAVWGPANAYGYQGGPYWPWGPRFVIVTRGSDHLIISGSELDAEHARALREKISGDFIWFEHEGKSYIIRDQAIIDRAKKIWSQRTGSEKQQRELQAKQQELSKQMREQFQQKMQEIRVKVPDMTAELQKLQSETKELNTNGASLQQLRDLQRQVGDLQRTLGEASWNSNMQEITRHASELGQQMGELGREIGEIASREVNQAFEASQQMRQLLDDAVARGSAKPE